MSDVADRAHGGRQCRWNGCTNVVHSRPPGHAARSVTGGSFCVTHWQLIRARERSWHWQLERLAFELWGVNSDQLRRLAE